MIDTIKEPGEYQFQLNENEFDEGSFLWKLNTDSIDIMVQIDDGNASGIMEGDKPVFNKDLIQIGTGKSGNK